VSDQKRPALSKRVSDKSVLCRCPAREVGRAPACSVNVRFCPNRGRGGGGFREDGIVALAFGGVQVAGLFEGRDDGGADGGADNRPDRRRLLPGPPGQARPSGPSRCWSYVIPACPIPRRSDSPRLVSMAPSVTNLSAGAGQVAAVQRLGRLNREQGPPGPTPKEG
jgi:hypothetical protein